MRFAVALLVALLILLPGIAFAQDAELVISTGQKGGSYHAIGQRLRTTLPEQRVDVVPSSGSLENLRRLDDPQSVVGVALAQADALKLYVEEHPEFADEFFVLGDVGLECALLVTGAAESPTRLSDLKAPEASKVVVGEEGSGAAVTLDHLGHLDPSFRRLAPAYEDTIEGLLQLIAKGGFTNVRAVLMVQRPSRISPPIELLMKKAEGYQLVAIREGEVPNASLPDGSPVYSFERITLGGERHHLKLQVETLCMRGFLLASKQKLSKDLRRDLSGAMAESRSYVVGLER